MVEEVEEVEVGSLQVGEVDSVRREVLVDLVLPVAQAVLALRVEAVLIWIP